MCTYTVVTHPCDIPPLAQARPMMLCIYTSIFIGASLSEPHTSESNGGFFIYIYIIIYLPYIRIP